MSTEDLIRRLQQGSYDSQSRRGAYGSMLSGAVSGANGAPLVGAPNGNRGSYGVRGLSSGGPGGGGSVGNIRSNFKNPQLRNAAAIASVGRRLGVGRKGILTGIAAALVESNIKELDYGHSSSIGPFQQQTAWGPHNARRNITSSAKMFYRGGRAGQPGYLDIPKSQRRSRGIGALAQEVQESAHPSRYADRVDEARRIYNTITRAAGRRVRNGKRRRKRRR